ncbi:LytR C-terminal domain-containing protein [Kibdelosporangium philippinense]|uniref:LytR C-terminal domain-containing protein n=1 Tax=Kibdelosporangium philippinense TaxID=211113 RepID=A0ABS8ZN25_9PSEU|nr:LytR C-terminal domain-containing protein [Kibdelosporangium philippinense]MCE7009134.1 LytR C-terminal domain-containing protein [Kibdelosporangium philippinense]
MTNPEQAGPTRPARLAGLGLIALALIALVIGLIQLLGGGDSDQAAPPPASSESQPPPPPPSETPTTPPPAPPTTGTTTTPPPATTTSSTPPPAPPTQAPNRSEPVRVYNNSFIEGLAERAANDFRAGGWNVVDTGPHQGKVPVTTVYYRPGTAEEAQAKELAQQFGLRPEPRFEGIKDASPGIIVIVTREYNPKSK